MVKFIDLRFQLESDKFTFAFMNMKDKQLIKFNNRTTFNSRSQFVRFWSELTDEEYNSLLSMRVYSFVLLLKMIPENFFINPKDLALIDFNLN